MKLGFFFCVLMALGQYSLLVTFQEFFLPFSFSLYSSFFGRPSVPERVWFRRTTFFPLAPGCPRKLSSVPKCVICFSPPLSASSPELAFVGRRRLLPLALFFPESLSPFLSSHGLFLNLSFSFFSEERTFPREGLCLFCGRVFGSFLVFFSSQGF